jgi:hypothetical protein
MSRTIGRMGLVAALLGALLLVAASVGGLTAVASDRGADAGVVSDSDAYLAIEFADGCPAVLTLTNTHSTLLDDVEVDVSGGTALSAPQSLAPGEGGTVEIGVSNPAPAELSVRILASGVGITVDADREYVVESDCTGVRTQGYWKNHPDAWPVENLELGGENYTAAEALALLGSPVAGDAALSLFHQAVAATLNVENGAPDACVVDALADADAWLAANPPGTGVTPGSAAWSGGGEAIKDELDDYNNGALCAPAEE